jgi:protein TonB
VRRGIVVLTIVISAALHIVVATGLVAVAKNRDIKRRAISVAVQGEKKKEKPKPPPPPKPIVHAAPKPAAPPPAAAPVHAAPVHAAPVATNLAMSNTGGGDLDVGPGIGLHGRADAPPPQAVKTASAISNKRLEKVKEEAGGDADAPCAEEPTKPVAEVKSELSYALHPQAQADGLEGTFRARLTIAASGEVSDVEVQAGIEPAFDAALVAALKTWRFKPAMACGKPVAGGTFVVKRTFELGD